MAPQLIDWGVSAVLLGILWQLMAWSMRRLARRLDRQDEDLAELKTGQAVLEKGQAELDARMAGLDVRVAGLDARVAGLEKGQAGLDVRVAGLDAWVAGLAEGQAGLDARVTGLEKGQERIDHNVLQVVEGIGVVKGELRRIAPREKVAAGGS